MTHPDTRPGFRAGVARLALAEYEDWCKSRGKYQDATRPLTPAALGALGNCAAWALQMIEAEERAADPATVGEANTAAAHLSTREIRDVLNVLAATLPTAVLAAVAEAGYGRG